MINLKSKYKILKEGKLLIVAHIGSLNLNSMLDFFESLSSNPTFSHKFDHIVDLNKVTFDLTSKDISKYVEHLENNSKIFGEKKIALITNSPNQVVFSTLFKEAQEQLQPLQSVQIFSTLESAYNFIDKKNITFNQVSQTVKQLKEELIA